MSPDVHPDDRAGQLPTPTLRTPLLRRVCSLSLACWVAAWGCVSADEPLDDRAAQLELFFVRSLLTVARSRPHQLKLRFDAMATSPFAFLRGSEALYWRDLRDPAMPFGSSELPDVDLVALQGDAHPENIGVYAGPTIELNDFDTAGFGRPHWEVRRAVAALLVALRQANPTVDRAAVARRLAEAYVATIAAGDLSPVDGSDVGAIVQKRVASAQKAGAERSELVDFTVVTGGTRRLKRGNTDPADPREALLDAPPAVIDALGATVAAYRQTLHDDAFFRDYFRVKDVARRCGQGVGSLTAVRMYALVEGPTASIDDDVILQLKEASDAALDADLALGAPYPDQAARVVDRQRRLQSSPAADPRLGHARLLDLPVVVSTITGFQKTVRITDLAGRSDADILGFATDVGATLARAHARGVTVDGRAALPSLKAWLSARGEAFVTDTTRAGSAYADQVVGDHARFLALRDRLGPTLGLTAPAPNDTPYDDPARAVLDPPCP